MDIKKQIEAWKKEGHRVVETPFDDGKSAFFSAPNRKQLKLIMSKGRSGVTDMTDSFVKNCYLGGEITKEMIFDETDTSYLAELTASIDELIGTKKMELKKH